MPWISGRVRRISASNAPVQRQLQNSSATRGDVATRSHDSDVPGQSIASRGLEIPWQAGRNNAAAVNRVDAGLLEQFRRLIERLWLVDSP